MTNRCAAVLVLIALAAGCAPVNEEVGLLDAPPLPGLDPGADTVWVRHDATPSITSHDRSHWDRQAVLIPLKQVEHRPHYASDVHFMEDTARQRGAYPTATTALEVPEPSWGHVAEGLVDPVYAVLLVGWWPFDWALNDRPPWKIERSPADNYAPAPAKPRSEHWRWVGVGEESDG